MRTLLLAALTVAACNDDYLVLSPTDSGLDPNVTGWCAVQATFQQHCNTCHGTASKLGGLDLQTDPYAAIVGVTSATSAELVLVVTGDPAASFLYRKMSGELGGGEGGRMPPGVSLPAATLGAISDWIASGATDVCDTPIDPVDPTRHHPVDFAGSAVHGQAAKMQEETCVSCHGADLTGQGAAVSCDSCHEAGWRTNCTFCHGDPVEGSGAPPRHLSGEDDGADATFVPHLTHVHDSAIKDALSCASCHATPTDVLTPGHVFLGDTTPGYAETDFSQSLSDAAVWDPSTGSCSNLYCHGNGRGDNGTMDHTATVANCRACHPDSTGASRTRWPTMSGDHDTHLREGITCAECHAATATATLAIVDPSLHVNGVKEVVFSGTMTSNGTTCTGTCHGENHPARRW